MPKISPIALSIREALEILGQKAPTAEVKVKVLELHPELADEVNDSRFSTCVVQNRRKKFDPAAVAAQAAGGRRPERVRQVRPGRQVLLYVRGQSQARPAGARILWSR